MSIVDLSQHEWVKEFDFDAIVEATSYEQQALWEFNNRDNGGMGYEWMQILHGVGVTIGQVVTANDSFPIVLALNAVRVSGTMIMFYQATSRVVDHDVIEQTMKHSFPNLTRTDANNFHNAVRAGVQRQKEREERISAVVAAIRNFHNAVVSAESIREVDVTLSRIYNKE